MVKRPTISPDPMPHIPHSSDRLQDTKDHSCSVGIQAEGGVHGIVNSVTVVVLGMIEVEISIAIPGNSESGGSVPVRLRHHIFSKQPNGIPDIGQTRRLLPLSDP
jgi:hypothetical protein